MSAESDELTKVVALIDEALTSIRDLRKELGELKLALQLQGLKVLPSPNQLWLVEPPAGHARRLVPPLPV